MYRIKIQAPDYYVDYSSEKLDAIIRQVESEGYTDEEIMHRLNILILEISQKGILGLGDLIDELGVRGLFPNPPEGVPGKLSVVIEAQI